jgi:uncharacterized protein (DUF849 family)
MATQKTWLEVSLNGPWGKAMQPGIPISVGKIVDQAVACAKAGAGTIRRTVDLQPVTPPTV